jgi:hypothetical protein
MSQSATPQEGNRPVTPGSSSPDCLAQQGARAANGLRFQKAGFTSARKQRRIAMGMSPLPRT